MDHESLLDGSGHPTRVSITAHRLPASPRLAARSARVRRLPYAPSEIDTLFHGPTTTDSIDITNAQNYTFTEPTQTWTASPQESHDSGAFCSQSQDNRDNAEGTLSRQEFDCLIIADGCTSASFPREPTPTQPPRQKCKGVKDPVYDSCPEAGLVTTLGGPSNLAKTQPGAASGVSDAQEKGDAKPLMTLLACHLPVRSHRPDTANAPTGSSANSSGGRSKASGNGADTRQSGGNSTGTNDGQSDDDTEEYGERGGNRGGSTTATGGAQPPLVGPLSCPYRKRNKDRFNVRDHVKCTKPFKDLSQVKKHVKDCHKKENGYQCLGCLQRFQSETDLWGHQMLQMCNAAAAQPSYGVNQPEDGINARVDALLIDRKGATKVSTWRSLWKVLFPEDTEIPSPEYEPCFHGETHEFARVVAQARIGAMERSRQQVVDMIQTGRCVDPESLASQLLALVDYALDESFVERFRDFELTILQNRQGGATAPVLVHSRTAGARQRKKRGNSDRDSGSTPQQPGGMQVQVSQPRPLQPLAPNVATSQNLPRPLAMSSYHTTSLHLQHQGYLKYSADGVQHAPNQDVWNAQTVQPAMTVAAAGPVQHSVHVEHMTPLNESWLHGDGSSATAFPVNMPRGTSSYPASRPWPNNISIHRGSITPNLMSPSVTHEGQPATHATHSVRYRADGEPGFDR